MARKFEPGISFGRSAQKLPFPLPESLSPSLSLPLALPPAIPKLNPESSRKANFFGCLKCVNDHPNLAFNRHSPRIASHCFTVAYSAPAFWQPLKLLLPSGFGAYRPWATSSGSGFIRTSGVGLRETKPTMRAPLPSVQH